MLESSMSLNFTTTRQAKTFKYQNANNGFYMSTDF